VDWFAGIWLLAPNAGREAKICAYGIWPKRPSLADSHRSRSTRSSRTRPGSNGQPPSPTAGWDSPLPGRRALGGVTSMVDRESGIDSWHVVHVKVSPNAGPVRS
jgi:hypothetical protein